jgi:DNA-binding CsgD family transcriptional regulator
MPITDNYNLYYQFIDKFLPCGFLEIDRSDPLVLKVEEMTEANDQFFFVGDILQLKILFTSKRSVEMLGIETELVDPAVFFTSTHPDDLMRHNVARTKLFNLGQELFIKHTGTAVLSTNFRIKNIAGTHTNKLVQCYLLHSWMPHETVFLLQIITDISWFKEKAYGYHYYTGNDLSFLRYPDKRLLLTGKIFSEKEFEILKLIAAGFNSAQIAEKVCRSVHTVNTHRRNILKKSGKCSTTELIFDMKERGVL